MTDIKELAAEVFRLEGYVEQYSAAVMEAADEISDLEHKLKRARDRYEDLEWNLKDSNKELAKAKAELKAAVLD